MNKLAKDKQEAVIAALVEGNSIRATVRMTGVAKNTVVKLLVAVGEACANFQDKVMRNLPCQKVQCDEIWSFCYAKQKNVPKPMQGVFGYGDVWTWVAIDAETKLIPCYMVGLRSALYAMEFTNNLKTRLSNRVQLTTDGLKLYVTAVEKTFGQAVDYAQLEKYYGIPQDKPANQRYSPSKCLGSRRTCRIGNPDPDHISTSFVERSNLTMRMSMRRFTRLTNAFSKKIENLECAIALHFMHYNFCRIHQTLRVTPAMAAGVSDHVWELSDIIDLAEGKEAVASVEYEKISN